MSRDRKKPNVTQLPPMDRMARMEQKLDEIAARLERIEEMTEELLVETEDRK